MNGQELLEGQDGAAIEEVLDELLLAAADARENLDCFFEFVMREEKTHQPVRIAPHQRVLNRFILDHDRCVIILPVGHSKSFNLVAYTLWSLGNNPRLRGAIVSATQGQAEKLVGMVRDYIDTSAELRLVFPHLRKSPRPGDHWTQTKLVVDRPPGIRDPSLVAIGIDGAIEGSRLNWVIVDDLLKADNTRTPDARRKVCAWVDSSVINRLDPEGSKIVFSNTPWHPDDLVMGLKKAGCATLTMDAAGMIEIQDDAERVRACEERGEPFVPWDSDELRPSGPGDPTCRLVSHDPDPDNEVTLWPERLDRQQLEVARRTANDAQAFLQSYMCLCRDDDAAWCKSEWIERCKRLARDKGVHGLVGAYKGPFQTFTGVDLAFSERDKSDDTAFFTFAVLPSGHRQVLDVEIGKWPTPSIMEKVLAKQRAFNSIVTVENNGAQRTIRDFCLKKKVDAPIKAFTTGRNKANPEYGLPSIFVEIENGAWLIPNDRHGRVHPHVQKWIDGLLNYQPAAHTADALMAMFFAREQARKFGALSGGQTGGLNGPDLDFVSR
jgi:hypothetical protein